MLQLIGSTVIGSIFLLGILAYYGDTVDYTNEKLLLQLTQERTASLMEIIEYDFRRIGSGMTYPSAAIIDTVEITFLSDVDGDGVPDSVRYYTSIPDSAAATPNPNDVILYRDVNGVHTIDVAEGVVSFNVNILDAAGNPTTDLQAVRMLDVTLTLESTFAYNGEYQRALWAKRIVPPNLITRSYINNP